MWGHARATHDRCEDGALIKAEPHLRHVRLELERLLKVAVAHASLHQLRQLQQFQELRMVLQDQAAEQKSALGFREKGGAVAGPSKPQETASLCREGDRHFLPLFGGCPVADLLALRAVAMRSMASRKVRQRASSTGRSSTSWSSLRCTPSNSSRRPRTLSAFCRAGEEGCTRARMSSVPLRLKVPARTDLEEGAVVRHRDVALLAVEAVRRLREPLRLAPEPFQAQRRDLGHILRKRCQPRRTSEHAG